MSRAANTSKKFQIYLNGDKFWELMENGKNLDELYPDHFKTEIVDIQYHNYMESILMPGEEYVLLPDDAYDYAMTSFGRIINCIFGTQVYIYISNQDAKVIARTYKGKMSKLFEQQGWKFDIKEIMNNYDKYNWKRK